MGMEERGKRLGKAAKHKAASAEAAMQELKNLIHEIPDSLNSLLAVVYPEAEYLDSSESKRRFGYTFLIAGQTVNNEQHERVCQTLLDRLRRIETWFGSHDIAVGPAIRKAEGLTIHEDLQSPSGVKGSLAPFDVLRPMAAGECERELLHTIMRTKADADWSTINNILRPGIVTIGLEQPEKSGDNHVPKSERSIPLIEAKIQTRDRDAPTEHEPEWSNYRTPKEWRELRRISRLPYSESTWRVLRKRHAQDMLGEPANEQKQLRVTRKLATAWGLTLPEFAVPKGAADH